MPRRRLQITREGARVVYLTLGPSRSITKLREHLASQNISIARSTLEKWCSEDDWVLAGEVFDEERTRRRDARLLDSVEDMEQRHADLGRTMQDMAQKALVDLQMMLAVSGGTGLGVRDAMRMADIGVKLERTARGISDAERAVISYNLIITPILEIFQDVIRLLDPSVQRTLSGQFAEAVDQLGQKLLPEAQKEDVTVEARFT